jgi:cytoskeleton protein RodZ
MDEIGSQLREARMRMRIDTGEVEVRTKIRAKYLRAMENEEWDLLPGDVRSFLRTYADFLGLDSRALLDEFRRRYESPSDHEPPPIAPPSRERRERELRRQAGGGFRIPPWAIVLVVLVIVAGVLWYVGTKNDNPNPSSSASAGHTTTTKHHSHHRRHTARRHHVVTRRPRVPSTVTVSLTVSSAVSTPICLENAQGHELVNGPYASGGTIPSGTAKKLLLTVESPSVTIKANGKTITNTATGAPVTYRITPTGHTVITTTTPNETCGR